MYCRINCECRADINNHTPITIVLDKFDTLFAKKDGQLEKKKDDAIKVIAKILQKLPEEERVSAIEYDYHGMSAIEYDMQSGIGLIVKVKEKHYNKVLVLIFICILGYFKPSKG